MGARETSFCVDCIVTALATVKGFKWPFPCWRISWKKEILSLHFYDFLSWNRLLRRTWLSIFGYLIEVRLSREIWGLTCWRVVLFIFLCETGKNALAYIIKNIYKCIWKYVIFIYLLFIFKKRLNSPMLNIYVS